MTIFRRVINACVAIWFAVSLWLGSNSGMGLPGLLLSVYGGGALLIAWAAAFALAYGFHRSFRRPWLEPVAIVAMWAGTYFGVFFEVRFLLSRPSLDRYASARIARNGQRVGLFLARETEVLPDGVVRIITTDCGLDDCGLVFSRGIPPRIGEDQYERLSGNWWRWWRSW